MNAAEEVVVSGVKIEGGWSHRGNGRCLSVRIMDPMRAVSAVNDLLDESEDLVSELGFVDRSALAYFTAAQILSNALPSRESVPLLAELEHAVLVDRIRQIVAELRGLAGDRGAHLWAGVQ